MMLEADARKRAPVFQVVYLTGAPAAGKSSLTKRLRSMVEPLQIWEFGERLTAYLNERNGTSIAQAELRERSAGLATPDDVTVVDAQLVDFVAAERGRSHVLIDSHPVTKERYGYRVTPYSLAHFRQLNPTQIWMLYTAPEVAVARIRNDAQGRPEITLEEARFHTQIQASVAATYGMALGIPIYFFDANRPPEELDAELSSRF